MKKEPPPLPLPDKQQTEAVFQELAKLDNVDYDRCREAKAKELGLRVGTLDTEVALRRPKSSTSGTGDDLEAWPEPVDGLPLLEQIYRIIKDHCIISDHSAVAIALWVMLTYSYDAFSILPILTLISPVKRCGKTTLLSVINGLVCNGMMASNISPAATYRMIEKFKPTLLADEADTFFKQNEELRGVFNSGHCRETAFIVRCDGDVNEPVFFSTWAPKALAMISSIAKVPDTIADRSVVVQMSRKKAGERVQKKSLSFKDDHSMLRRMLMRWGMDSMPELRKIEVNLPNLGNDRMTDNWIPLTTIALHLYEDWYDRAIKAMRELSGYHADADDSVSIMILEDIRDLFVTDEKDRLSSEEIINSLIAMDDRPWPEWKNGKPISKAGLARLLKPFKINSKSVRIGSSTPKGYLLEHFLETFSRYLPPLETETPQQKRKNSYLEEFQAATQGNNVADGKDSKQLKFRDCCGVADKNTPAGDEVINEAVNI